MDGTVSIYIIRIKGFGYTNYTYSTGLKLLTAHVLGGGSGHYGQYYTKYFRHDQLLVPAGPCRSNSFFAYV